MSDKELILEVDSYEFKDTLSFFMICYALSELKKYSLVINLYEKFKNKIKDSGNEIIGLQTIISICIEKNETVFINKYTSQLEKRNQEINGFN
jgi:hypothetical protein